MTNAIKYTKEYRGWMSIINIDLMAYVVKMNRVAGLTKPAKSAMNTVDEKKLSTHAA